MKTLELENNSGLAFLTNTEMQALNGGFLAGGWSPIRFVISEVADFIQGVGEGYNYVRNN